MSTLRGFAPIIDTRARTLILGSFPSEASLKAQQYYAHKQNQFWKIMGALLNQSLYEMDYAARWPYIQAAGIAVWDVYATCEREGSLDSDIRLGVTNDFARLRTLAPKLERVCFNGQTAAKFQRLLHDMDYEVHVLPSSSPAYTLAFDRKFAAWREALLIA
ncbi:MAG TPA: DNA-deoxyinosine glycosylase [Rhodocyclaceae bacterium]|nr:DNA-deoxyinosine glycosylase [Rhodocyclaceae bacterium]